MTEPSDHPGRIRVVTSALALHEPPPEPPGLAPEPPPPPPVGAVLHPPAPADAPHRAWLPLQIWGEVQLAVRMHFDSRYRISRTSQFLGPVILGLFVLNYFVFNAWLWVPVVSSVVNPVVERVFCVVLGLLWYKLLLRELARYRDVLDYLNRYGR